MKHVVCYCMTRNLYEDFKATFRSLLKNGGKIDKIYVLAEDDDLGYPVPDIMEVINVSDQKFFPKDGPNYNQHWTYMALMRVALCKIFPDLDYILTLDVDTIVLSDLAGIWNCRIGNNYFAGVKESYLSNESPYINCGIVLWNLKQLRDGKADEIIRMINTKKYRFPEQDCVNQLCKGRIYQLPSSYNATNFTAPTKNIIIRHYANAHALYRTDPLVKQYMEDESDEM